MQIERITHNPAVLGGKPCIRGLRVTVGTILGLHAPDKSHERILQAYPDLELRFRRKEGGRGWVEGPR